MPEGINIQKLVELMGHATALTKAMQEISTKEDSIPIMLAMEALHQAEGKVLVPKLTKIAAEAAVEDPTVLEEVKNKFGENHPFFNELKQKTNEIKNGPQPTAKEQEDIDDILRRNFPGMMNPNGMKS